MDLQVCVNARHMSSDPSLPCNQMKPAGAADLSHARTGQATSGEDWAVTPTLRGCKQFVRSCRLHQQADPTNYRRKCATCADKQNLARRSTEDKPRCLARCEKNKTTFRMGSGKEPLAIALKRQRAANHSSHMPTGLVTHGNKLRAKTSTEARSVCTCTSNISRARDMHI
jgi:hypothetical protein